MPRIIKQGRERKKMMMYSQSAVSQSVLRVDRRHESTACMAICRLLPPRYGRPIIIDVLIAEGASTKRDQQRETRDDRI